MDQRGRTKNRAGIGQRARWAIACLVIALIGVVVSAQEVRAAQRPPDSACQLCHMDNEESITLPSGESLPLGVDGAVLDASVHGDHVGVDVYCTDCHRGRERYQYPHEPNPAETLAEFAADVSQNCRQCHPSLESHNPGHLNAAPDVPVPTCADCHGGHDTAPVAEIYTDPIGYCLSCHRDFEHPQVDRAHAELVQNMGAGQDCLMCHNGEPVYPADTQCRTCHTLLTGDRELPSGDKISLHVDMLQLSESVHGKHQAEDLGNNPLLCTDCHVDVQRYGFPHPDLTAADLRGLRMEMDDICQSCHEEIFQKQIDGVHGRAQEEGVDVAATCVDCHGNHNIQDPDEPREHVSETCAQCHSTINAQYEESVHGAALLGEHNPDVPVCTDCHGVHDIANPRTAEFRVNSPTLCAGCHADKDMMDKYGISTDVFDTYVADFHGTTVELFEKQSPDHETNKAVCYDCHGVHNILPATDEHSQVIRENLLTTCQQCHPDADANFPAAWTSHFKPSLEHNPLVFLVDWFYRLLIPAVLGGFALFIGTDVYRTARIRRSKKESDHDHS